MRGRVASDCEEQANTLASILRARGVKAEDVRVVLGKVNFEGSIGGHAWVEVFEDGMWIPLEATSGDYWDDERVVESEGLPFCLFQILPLSCHRKMGLLQR